MTYMTYDSVGEPSGQLSAEIAAKDIQGRIMPAGSSDFAEVVEKKLVVIDKTLFIEEFMNHGAKVCCILRPRRFGKSTNLNMLKSFLSIGTNPKDFDRFAIGKNEAFVKEHCGKYPVIYFNLKGCKGCNWEEMHFSIWKEIVRAVRPHAQRFPDLRGPRGTCHCCSSHSRLFRSLPLRFLPTRHASP